jgi:hypothetical protein
MAKILADTQIRKELERVFSCTRKTVSEALNCRSNSDLSKRIRMMAIKLGGAAKKEERVIIK